MWTIFSSKKEEQLKSIENRLYRLVDRKEKQLQAIDDHGRDLVLSIQEYLGNLNGKSSVDYRSISKEAKRYLRENQHYM